MIQVMEDILWSMVCILLRGNWLPDEAKQSSTWRELVAVGRVLMSVAGKIA